MSKSRTEFDFRQSCRILIFAFIHHTVKLQHRLWADAQDGVLIVSIRLSLFFLFDFSFSSSWHCRLPGVLVGHWWHFALLECLSAAYAGSGCVGG